MIQVVARHVGAGRIAQRVADLQRLFQVCARRGHVPQAQGAGAQLVQCIGRGRLIAQCTCRLEHPPQDLAPSAPAAAQGKRALDRPCQAQGLSPPIALHRPV